MTRIEGRIKGAHRASIWTDWYRYDLPSGHVRDLLEDGDISKIEFTFDDKSKVQYRKVRMENESVGDSATS